MLIHGFCIEALKASFAIIRHRFFTRKILPRIPFRILLVLLSVTVVVIIILLTSGLGLLLDLGLFLGLGFRHDFQVVKERLRLEKS